jgi:selenium metabolism protein YedF
MACPVPVVTTKRTLEEGNADGLEVLLDDGAPRENVTRFARNRGYKVTEKPVDGGFALTITGAGPSMTPSAQIAAKGNRVLLFTTDRLGNGPEELGRLLMKNFIITLLDLPEPPDRMLFLNSGIHLTCEDSDVLEALDILGNRGAEILSCGICLDFFHKKDKLKAGAVTNMFTTAETLMEAASVIRL